MNTPGDMLLSSYLVEHNIGFGVSCTRKIVTAEEIGDVLYTDCRVRVNDLQECIRNVWTVCKAESVVTMNSGAIVNMANKCIEFTITAGGWPFDGAKEAITSLHRLGVPTFIASGDRVTKLEKMADHLGIPRDRVYGVATPTVKAQIVNDLRQDYDRVLMVGDGINDLCAMQNADIAILTIQQPGERPEELFKEADYVVQNVNEVVTIVKKMISSTGHSDRDDCDASYKR
jgi:Cu+-exporting ATPase